MQSQLSNSLQVHQQLLLDWQELVQSANHAFIACQYDVALASYQAAELTCANQMSMLLSNKLDDVSINHFAHCATAWVVTMHNIADCLTAKNLLAQASLQLYHAYEAMTRLTLHRNSDIAKIATRQSHRCYQQWLQHGVTSEAALSDSPLASRVLH